MTYPQDDNEALWVPPNVENPPRYVIGVLEEWNNETFANAVRYRGAVLRNLAVINGLEALGFAPGIQVSLLGHSGTGALVSFAILGRYVQPGATATTEAIQSLQSTVALALGGEIAAANIFSATAIGTETRADSAGFATLANGPTLEVPVSHTGKVIVHLSTSIIGGELAASGFATAGGRMGVDLSGANTVAASPDRSVAVFAQFASTPSAGTTTDQIELGGRFGTTFAIDGLAPGLTTFTAMYARLFVGDTCDFTDRVIVVQRA